MADVLPTTTPGSRARHAWAIGIGLAMLMIWCAVDVRQRGFVDLAHPEIHRTDFTVYSEAGAALFDGRDPYQVTNVRGWGYLYLPLFALLVAPLHGLAPQWQVFVWFWLSVLTAWGAWRELLRLDAWGRALDGRLSTVARPRLLLICGAIVAVLPALNCLQRGQVGILQLYLTLLGARLTLTSRRPAAVLTGSLVLALAVVLKLTPLLPTAAILFALLVASLRGRAGAFLPPRLESLRWRTTQTWSGVVLGLLVAIVLLPSLVLGWQRNLSCLQSWELHVGQKTGMLDRDSFAGDSHSFRNQSPMNAVWLCGNWVCDLVMGDTSDSVQAATQSVNRPMDSPLGQTIVVWIRRFAVALAAIGIAVAAWRGERRSLLLALALANAATLLVAPIARGHYYLALLPAVVWAPQWLAPETAQWTHWRDLRAMWNRNSLIALVVIAPPLLSVMHYVLLDFAGRLGLLGLGTLAWFVVVVSLVVGRQWRRSQATMRGGASLVPLRRAG